MTVPSGSIKALDEPLDLPHVNALLRHVLAHLEGDYVYAKVELVLSIE